MSDFIEKIKLSRESYDLLVSSNESMKLKIDELEKEITFLKDTDLRLTDEDFSKVLSICLRNAGNSDTDYVIRQIKMLGIDADFTDSIQSGFDGINIRLRKIKK